MDMDKDYLHSVNLDLLQDELGMNIQSISKLVDVSVATIYKWNKSREFGGSRPTYDALYTMFSHGATTKSLFGVECAMPSKEINKDDFLAGVRQALADLAASSPNVSK